MGFLGPLWVIFVCFRRFFRLFSMGGGGSVVCVVAPERERGPAKILAK